MWSNRPPVDEIFSFFRAAIAKEGVTTGAGAAAGNSIIDAGLIGIGADSYLNMLMILYPGDPDNVESARNTAFNNVTGEITLEHAYKGVAAAIPAGTAYKIVTFPFATGLAVAGILAVVNAIYNIVNAILVDTETGGTLTTDGAVQILWENNAPFGCFEPLVLKIDFTNQTAAETVMVRTYERIVAGGGLVEFDYRAFAGVQDPLGRYIDLKPNRFGVRVTIERTAGVAQDYDWEIIRRE